MDEYGHGIDVWPMGIIGYELTYGLHPLKLAVNPWRRGNEYERLRPTWKEKYEKAIDLASADHRQWLRQRTGGDRDYLHCKCEDKEKEGSKLFTDYVNSLVGDLLVQMMRQPWAKHNSARRIFIDEALRQQAWEHISVVDPQTKRGKAERAEARS
jgi:hypothetical protein